MGAGAFDSTFFSWLKKELKLAGRPYFYFSDPLSAAYCDAVVF